MKYEGPKSNQSKDTCKANVKFLQTNKLTNGHTENGPAQNYTPLIYRCGDVKRHKKVIFMYPNKNLAHLSSANMFSICLLMSSSIPSRSYKVKRAPYKLADHKLFH